MTDLHRAERFLEKLQERTSEEIVPWSGGIAYLHSGLPKVWDLNLVRVEDDRISAEEIAAEADRLMAPAGCTHRRVTLDERRGSALEEDFTRLGWEVDVHVVMGHQREPDEDVDTSAVQEVGSQTWPSRAEQLGEHPGMDGEVLDQMRVLYEMLTEAARARDFAILRDGRAASFALLFSDGATGQIEDVATLAEYRQQGLSRAVMAKVLEVSRSEHDFTFLVADDRDWPKQFYARLGFEELGRHYFFLKRPPA